MTTFAFGGKIWLQVRTWEGEVVYGLVSQKRCGALLQKVDSSKQVGQLDDDGINDAK